MNLLPVRCFCFIFLILSSNLATFGNSMMCNKCRKNNSKKKYYNNLPDLEELKSKISKIDGKKLECGLGSLENYKEFVKMHKEFLQQKPADFMKNMVMSKMHKEPEEEQQKVEDDKNEIEVQVHGPPDFTDFTRNDTIAYFDKITIQFTNHKEEDKVMSVECENARVNLYSDGKFSFISKKCEYKSNEQHDDVFTGRVHLCTIKIEENASSDNIAELKKDKEITSEKYKTMGSLKKKVENDMYNRI